MNKRTAKPSTKPDPFCYLCNRKIARGDLSRDHVPPEQLYASVYKKKDIAKNLLTLPTHKECNKAYQHDEDYFVFTLGPLVGDSVTGREFWNDLARRMRRPEAAALNAKIRDEFIRESTPKVTLPPGKVGKRYDGARVRRIVWKIVRGLFWREFGRFLPETGFGRKVVIVSPFIEPPKEFALLNECSFKGQYGAVFDYKFRVAPEHNNFSYCELPPIHWTGIEGN